MSYYLTDSAADNRYINPPPIIDYNKYGYLLTKGSGSKNLKNVDLFFAKQKIAALASMQDNWDGYGALKINPETRQNALTALQTILGEAPTPDIVPNPNGTISFEWESSQGVGYLEIGRSKYSFYIKHYSGPDILYDGFTNKIEKWIGLVVAKLLFQSRNITEPVTIINYSDRV